MSTITISCSNSSRRAERCSTAGNEAAAETCPYSARPRIFDGAAEAKLIALTCGPAPAGCARWTLSLLERKVVELKIVEKASDNTIGRTLKETFSSRISSRNG
jgi:hypothetical protein